MEKQSQKKKKKKWKSIELSGGLWSCAPRMQVSEGVGGQLEQKEVTKNKTGEVVEASLWRHAILESNYAWVKKILSSIIIWNLQLVIKTEMFLGLPAFFSPSLSPSLPSLSFSLPLSLFLNPSVSLLFQLSSLPLKTVRAQISSVSFRNKSL